MKTTDRDHEALQRAIAQLPREQLPQRDLWPGIELAINEAAPAVKWKQHTALAASLLLVLAASLQFGRVQPEPGAAGIERDVLVALQSEHINSKQALLVQYQDEAPLYQDWEMQMQQLEQAEQVIYNALREEPGNLELLKMLRLVQQKQLNLIDSVFSPRLTSI
jgi:hypothetical protein